MKKLIPTLLILTVLAPLTTHAQLFTEQTDVVIPGTFAGSADWGDYNNDGLLDFVITGHNSSPSIFYAGIFKNLGSNVFEENIGTIIPVSYSCLDWGDYNNDNYIDIVYAGLSTKNGQDFEETEICRNNSDETFTELESTGLSKMSHGSIKWYDYSEDAYLDIFQSGNSSGYLIARIYKNNRNDGFLYQTDIDIEGVQAGSVDWGDYNNDGLPDFIYTGTADSYWITKIYKNNGDNTFTAQDEIDIIDIAAGSTEWGDYNNDGYLDFAVTGQHETGKETIIITKIYKNNGGESFTELQGIDFVGITLGGAFWGDYNNDGLLDLILAGWTEVDGMGQPQARIYLNEGNDIFTEQSPAGLTPVGDASVAWGDYDNDNDLDLILAGVEPGAIYTTKLYKNNTPVPNIRPNTINNLKTQILGDEVWFSWDAATDDNQPSPGLSYNIYVYDEDSPLPYIASPQAFPQSHALNGKRLLAQRGHIQGIRENGRVSYRLKGVFEDCKSYRWSVQAVDASFAGGEFAPEASFIYDTIAPEIVCPENLEVLIPHNQTNYTMPGTELDPVAFSDDCDTVIISNNYNSDTTLQGAVFPLGITEIEWTASDLAGNKIACTVSIEVKQSISASDINTQHIILRPNPSSGNFTLDLPSEITSINTQIHIRDICGRLIKTINITGLNNKQSIQIDMTGSEPGIYILSISNTNIALDKKIIIN